MCKSQVGADMVTWSTQWAADIEARLPSELCRSALPLHVEPLEDALEDTREDTGSVARRTRVWFLHT